MRQGKPKTMKIGVHEGLRQIRTDAAGIDVGASEIWVDVGVENNASPVQRFETFTADLNRMAKFAKELIDLQPDVILAVTTPSVAALRQQARTIPIVFVVVSDPVGSGFVESLARPGGNTTGFISFDYSMSAKWLELLKDTAPQVARVAVLYGPRNPGGLPMFTAIQVVAPSLRVELSSAAVRDAGEIERDVAALARFPNGGLIVTRTTEVMAHGDLIVALAARHRLPTVYPSRSFVTRGGLISYGNDVATDYRMAAGYIDRIFKGEKPADLPVQYPTKYDLLINLKTAKALGLEVPPTLLARADEVIE